MVAGELFHTVRPVFPGRKLFAATGYTLQGRGDGSNRDATPRFVVFGRTRDLPWAAWFRQITRMGAATNRVRVGGAFAADGQLARNFQYTGACPVDLTFDWGVIGTDATSVAYSFTRNDGGSSSSQIINLPRANQSVPIVEHWRLGANTRQFSNYTGWVQLNIRSPNPVSNKINFTIHCQ